MLSICRMCVWHRTNHVCFSSYSTSIDICKSISIWFEINTHAYIQTIHTLTRVNAFVWFRFFISLMMVVLILSSHTRIPEIFRVDFEPLTVVWIKEAVLLPKYLRTHSNKSIHTHTHTANSFASTHPNANIKEHRCRLYIFS